MLTTSSLLALCLASFTSAIPSYPIQRRQAPNYPPHSTSNAFTLIANVSEPYLSTPLGTAINKYTVNSYHSGAGTSFGVLTQSSNATTGRIFYENGTASEVRFGQGDVLTDGGSPTVPYGLIVQQEDQKTVVANSTGRDTYINVGNGTVSIGMTSFPNPVLELATKYGAWAACNVTLLYGQAIQLQVRYPSDSIVNGTLVEDDDVPDGCVAVSLLPQCAELNTLEPGSLADHTYAVEVGCYDNVSAIDWCEYSV